MAAFIALLQLGIIGGMLAKGLHPLWTGRTVEFRTTPLDPRDLLRGQYVRLNYDFSRIHLISVEHDLKPKGYLLPGETVFVGLEKKDGRWRAVEFRRVLPDVSNRPTKRIYLKGVVRLPLDLNKYLLVHPVEVDYGLERYYTDPDRALELEKIARRKPVKVIVAVTDAGISRIRDIKMEEKKKPRP